MNVLPIKDGPRLSKEEAEATLEKEGFTKLEATFFLMATKPSDRLLIFNKVIRRLKEEQK